MRGIGILFSVLCIIIVLGCTGCTTTNTAPMNEGIATPTVTDGSGSASSFSACTAPVNPKKLISFLPSPPSGWQATETIENIIEEQSGVARGYVFGTPDRASASVRIIDTCNRTVIQELIAKREDYRDERGYYTKIQVGGYPGVESFTQLGAVTYSCNVFVAERYWIIVQTYGTIKKEPLYQFVDSIDYKSLADLR